MSSSTPLDGSELIDCAKANSEKDIKVVSERCGYDEDIAAFERELKKACSLIGVEIKRFEDLREDELENQQKPEIEIAPKNFSTQL